MLSQAPGSFGNGVLDNTYAWLLQKTALHSSVDLYSCSGTCLANLKCDSPLQVSITVMVSGAVIAGATDLSYSLPGYIWVAICAISTAVYLLLIRKLSDKTGKRLDGHPMCVIYT